MKRMRFNAQELYVLAALSGKKKMYGIPNGFEWLPDDEVNVVRQEVSDALLEEGILSMDFDGEISVSPDYRTLVNAFCDCKRCLTVNRQEPDGNFNDQIFWYYKGTITQATADEGSYFFSEVSPSEVKAELLNDEWKSTDFPAYVETIIPQIFLEKAKRYALKNTEETLRILRQNNADERTAAILCDGLQCRAHYFRIILMDMSSGECVKSEKSWLESRGITVSMNTTIVNFRTCTKFVETEEKCVKAEIAEFVSLFLQEK